MTAAISVIGFVLMAWYLVATLYLVFRDEMLSRLIGQQTEMQQAYEDRLAALRNQIDRVTSRQLVDQNSVEAKLQELISRHAQLESRHAIVAQLAEQPALAGARQQALRPANPSRPISEAPLATGSIQSFAPQPRPLPATEAFELRGGRDFAPQQAPERRLNQSDLMNAPPAVIIAEMRDATDRIERQQMAALEGMERHVRQRAQRLSQAFAETGLDAERFASTSKAAAQGGPLVPLQTGKAAGPFELRLSQTQFAIQQTERMRRIFGSLPINRPMPEEFEQTSGFGPRSDPFTRSMAMHTGLDFRAPTGSPVRATAAGKVTEAGWMGGYGNMVEIDHGNGLTTRYAHLSSIAVNAGDSVARGATIGRVGSTGRSTGPHLHYETRIDGDPADPLRFIRAGQKLDAR